MEIKGAITSKSPRRTQTSAIAALATKAMRGSLPFPYPFEKKRGSTRSLAKACKVRGAATKLARAEDRVAAQRPAMIKGGKMAMSCMTKLLPCNSSRSPIKASQQSWAR